MTLAELKQQVDINGTEYQYISGYQFRVIDGEVYSEFDHEYYEPNLTWLPIKTAPRDGTEIIVGVDIADTWIVRSAWWRDGTKIPNFDVEDTGWWSYKNSVTQEMLEGIYAPTHWLCEVPEHQN